MIIEKSAQEIFNILKESIINKSGKIQFTLHNTTVIVESTDTVGNTLQSWMKQWFINSRIYYDEPNNTQEFPDFYLSKKNRDESMLEIKAFIFNNSPAFDIANYESYMNSISNNPFRLNANYLIIGYEMDSNGNIFIRKLWLKKIWEISGKSQRYPIKTQVKRDVIYNIRPNSEFKRDLPSPFKNKYEFLKALFQTHSIYRGLTVAKEWEQRFKASYKRVYNIDIDF